MFLFQNYVLNMPSSHLKNMKNLFFFLCITVLCFATFFSVYMDKYERKRKPTTRVFPLNQSFSVPLSPTVQIFTIYQSTAETINGILKGCLDPFLSVFKRHEVPILLFDKDILSELIQPQAKIQNNSVQMQNSLYKSYLEKDKLIIFAIEATKFKNKNKTIVKDLESCGFIIHLSMDVDPRGLAANGSVQFIPTYLWSAKEDHVIQVVLLHKRLDSYLWSGPVNPDEWKITAKALAPALTDSQNRMEKVGIKIPKHARAFNTTRFLFGLPLKRNKEEIHLPFDIATFLVEYENSQFIECHYKRAKQYKEKYEISLTSEDEDFKNRAKTLILKAKLVLDKLNVPFSLSSGSCLGWFRQCDIIPFTGDVDFDILVQNYNENIVEEMQNAGLKLLYKFGKVNDSLEYSFIGTDRVKLDIFFIYEEKDHFWFSGLRGSDLKKYKYKLPIFTLCWTEFLGMKIRVPCNPETYIEANYGKNWTVPETDWIWNQSPLNLENNGMWNTSDRKDVFQTF